AAEFADRVDDGLVGMFAADQLHLRLDAKLFGPLPRRLQDPARRFAGVLLVLLAGLAQVVLGRGVHVERFHHGEDGDPGVEGAGQFKAAFQRLVRQRRTVGWQQQVAVHAQSSPRITSTGMLEWVRTFWVTLPTSRPLTPRRPCEAITIRSQPPFAAASMIWR